MKIFTVYFFTLYDMFSTFAVILKLVQKFSDPIQSMRNNFLKYILMNLKFLKSDETGINYYTALKYVKNCSFNTISYFIKQFKRIGF